jgi:SAM-dependent methyltransferase
MTTPYRWLALYYDELFGAFRGPAAAAREHVLRRIMPRVASACDLACGTGDTAIELARLGIRMYAVDLSPGMCAAARAKARAAAVAVRVVRADMRSFRLPERVDLITCEFDAVNHVPARADLAKVARTAARALAPDGHFYFDVNNAAGFRSYWNNTLWREIPGACFAMRSAHDADGLRAWADIDWFLRDGRGWQRRKEKVEEVCWTAAEIRSALRKAGFDRVRGWDAARFFPAESGVGRGCRTVYLAHKRGC